MPQMMCAGSTAYYIEFFTAFLYAMCEDKDMYLSLAPYSLGAACEKYICLLDCRIIYTFTETKTV